MKSIGEKSRILSNSSSQSPASVKLTSKAPPNYQITFEFKKVSNPTQSMVTTVNGDTVTITLTTNSNMDAADIRDAINNDPQASNWIVASDATATNNGQFSTDVSVTINSLISSANYIAPFQFKGSANYDTVIFSNGDLSFLRDDSNFATEDTPPKEYAYAIQSQYTGLKVDFASEDVDWQIGGVIPQLLAVVLKANPSPHEYPGLKFDEPVSLFTDGPSITIITPLGTEYDRQKQAEVLALEPTKYRDKRVRLLWPDFVNVDVDGAIQTVPSYYMAATLAGLHAFLPPEQGHSELPIPGYVSLLHSNDYFTETQLTQMTAAGLWIYVQDVEGGPIVCRKQYTTDTTTEETAESSLTLIVDAIRRDIRASVRPIMGVNNLTPQIRDRVAFIINSVINKYKARNAIERASIRRMNFADKTTLEVTMDVKPFGPFNLLRITILI
jgi:hypothetical protein